jgi:hypothetical protein
MDSIIKLNSIISGDYNSSNNRIDFDIYDGTYDFQQSYVNIRADLITPEIGTTITAGYKGVHLVQIGKGSPGKDDAQYQLHPIALVKNCYLNSSTQGNIDDIREVRLLQNTLKTYTESTSEQLSNTYDSTYQRTLASRTKHSVFRELYRSGDVMSRNVSSNIRIPLSDLSGVGSLSSYTVSPNEKLRLHLEIDKSGLQFYSTSDWNMYGPNGNMVNFELDDYTNNSGGPESEAIFESINNFINEKDIPLWTGQLVDVRSATNSPGLAIVKSIQLNGINLSITLTQLRTPIPNGTALTDIYMTRVPCELDPTKGIDLRLYDAEIVLHKKANTVKAQPTEFSTYTTEQFNANGQTDFRRMFQVEPNCVNLMVMFPRDNAFSFNDNVQNYRIALNNIYLSDREISFTNGQWDSLYLDELQRLFMNANLPLNCLSQIEPFFNGDGTGYISKTTSYFGSGTYTGIGNEPFKHKILGTPLPLTAGEKNVELDIQSTGTGIEEMILFKQVTRVVSA